MHHQARCARGCMPHVNTTTTGSSCTRRSTKGPTRQRKTVLPTGCYSPFPSPSAMAPLFYCKPAHTPCRTAAADDAARSAPTSRLEFQSTAKQNGMKRRSGTTKGPCRSLIRRCMLCKTVSKHGQPASGYDDSHLRYEGVENCRSPFGDTGADPKAGFREPTCLPGLSSP